MVQFDFLSFFIQLVWLYSFIFIAYIFILNKVIVKLGTNLKWSVLYKQMNKQKLVTWRLSDRLLAEGLIFQELINSEKAN